jgi:hypothetical protein
MAGPSRTLKLTYLGDASQLKKTNQDLDKDFNTLGDRFKKFGVNAAKAFAVAGAAAGAMAVKFGKDAVDAASDLNESINALEVVFGPVSEEMLKLSDAAATTVGLSKAEFNSLAVTFSSFTKRLATDNKDAVAVTDELTQRIADFASVMNLEVADAGAKFQSILAGSSEVSRQFGIDTSAAAVAQYALEEGLITARGEMDEATRITATYKLLMEETEIMTGDFAETSDELANSQRILKAEFENAKAEAGQQLLPVMKDLVGFIREQGIPLFGEFIDRIRNLIDRVREFWQTHGPNIKESFDTIKTAVIGVWENLQIMFEDLGSIFSVFDDNTKENSGVNKFVQALQFIADLIAIIGQVIEETLAPLKEFLGYIDRIVNSRIFELGVLPTVDFLAGRDPGARFEPTIGRLDPGRPVTGPVQGPNSPNVVITVNGAVDPETTARQIRRLQDDALARSGPAQTLRFDP